MEIKTRKLFKELVKKLTLELLDEESLEEITATGNVAGYNTPFAFAGDEKKRIYSDPRCFSIYELLIVSSLPLNWNIPTWSKEQEIRKIIGEGIPSLLVKYIFQELLTNLQNSKHQLAS